MKSLAYTYLTSILFILLILSLGSCTSTNQNIEGEKKEAKARATSSKEPTYRQTSRTTRKAEIQKPDWEGVFEEEEIPAGEKVVKAEEELPPTVESEPTVQEQEEPEPLVTETAETTESTTEEKKEENAGKLPPGSSWEEEFIKDMESIKENKAARDNMTKNLVSLFPLADEILLGEAVAARTLSSTAEFEDHALWEYVSFVGVSLAEVSARNDLAYHFVVLDDKEINAFAAPGGYIFITLGAVKFCENEAELAAILAHELAHVGLKHGLRNLDLSKYRIMSEMMVTEMDEAFGRSEFFDLKKSIDPRFKEIEKELAQIADQCFEQTQCPYGKDLEREADTQSLKILSAAGYNPYAAISLMERLAGKMVESPDWAGSLHSHPSPTERIEVLKSEAERLGLKNRGALNRERFRAALENMR